MLKGGIWWLEPSDVCMGDSGEAVGTGVGEGSRAWRVWCRLKRPIPRQPVQPLSEGRETTMTKIII